MIKRVSITGTESTGKTTLGEKLSKRYNTICVPDFSRKYIGQLNRKYNREDLLEIAEGIIEEEDALLKDAYKIIFSDNDLVNIKIWLQFYDWEVPEWLEEAIIKRRPDLYLFCDIDIAWKPDEQRKNRKDRRTLFKRFRKELERINAKYVLISGIGEQRLLQAVKAIQQFI